MSVCQGLTGNLFGHKFEPRYSTEEVFQPEIANLLQRATHISSFMMEQIDNIKSKRRTYEHDVCTRCGETTVRNKQ